MGTNSYSNMYGAQSYGAPQYGAQPAYGQPQQSYRQQPAYTQPEAKPAQGAAPEVWGTGTPQIRPWYLQTWFIVLMICSIIGFVPGIILTIMQSDYDKKMFARYKTISDADMYWAYVKEDCAKIYREATERSDKLLEESKQKAQITEQTANQYLLKVDKECKAKRQQLQKEMEDLIAQRDFLQEEIRQIQEGQVTMSEDE
ncbi:MAG: hypothetical protein K5695_18175 [Oscillospiraceae bacterium]|nr:hypothetical protein [Oscillospiraceae bacterium]